MYKDIPPDDRSIAKPYKLYKTFKFNETDSGSGIFAIQGLSGSTHNFRTGSSVSQSAYSLVCKLLWYVNPYFPCFVSSGMWKFPIR